MVFLKLHVEIESPRKIKVKIINNRRIKFTNIAYTKKKKNTNIAINKNNN